MKISGSGKRDLIDLDEEYLFRLIEVHGLQCPILDGIWESFYEGPRIHPEDSVSIVTELDTIDKLVTESKMASIDSKAWTGTYQRLRKFFDEAGREKSVVDYQSD